jgi:hypothetical protein
MGRVKYVIRVINLSMTGEKLLPHGISETSSVESESLGIICKNQLWNNCHYGVVESGNNREINYHLVLY